MGCTAILSTRNCKRELQNKRHNFTSTVISRAPTTQQHFKAICVGMHAFKHTCSAAQGACLETGTPVLSKAAKPRQATATKASLDGTPPKSSKEAKPSARLAMLTTPKNASCQGQLNHDPQDRSIPRQYATPQNRQPPEKCCHALPFVVMLPSKQAQQASLCPREQSSCFMGTRKLSCRTASAIVRPQEVWLQLVNTKTCPSGGGRDVGASTWYWPCFAFISHMQYGRCESFKRAPFKCVCESTWLLRRP